MSKIIFIFSLLLLLTACGGNGNTEKEKPAQAEQPLLLEVIEKTEVEYGAEFDYQHLILSGHYDLINASEVNTYLLGKQKLIITAYLKGKSIQKEVQIVVVDTTPPEFTHKVETLEVLQGKPIILSQFIGVDPVDGRVPVYLSQKVDVSIAGDYQVEVIASDKHGNVTSTPLVIKVIGQNVSVPEVSQTTTNQQSSESALTDSNQSSEPVASVEPSQPTVEPTPQTSVDPTPAPILPVYVEYTPEGKEFLFKDGYDFTTAYNSCSSYLSGQLAAGFIGTAECVPMTNSNDIYIGYKAIFY